jgi:hypothetical protein
MSKIDLDEFRATLGVGTLYPDSTLQQVADASEAIIDGMLDYNRSTINSFKIVNGYATLFTLTEHSFFKGDSILVSGINGDLNGTRTVTAVGVFSVEFATGASNSDVRLIKPFGTALLASQTTLFDAVPAVREASLAIAVEIFQQRTAAGGQVQAVDYTPSPHRLGRALLNRVHGLLAPYMDMGGIIG